MMMWVPFNPNPLGKQVGDCAVRAISCALEKDWDSAFVEMAVKSLEMADMPSANSVFGSLLKSKGFEKSIVPDTCPDCYTVAEFCEDNPKGVYVLISNGHTVAVKDGDYYDSFDSGNETVIYYWRKK